MVSAGGARQWTLSSACGLSRRGLRCPESSLRCRSTSPPCSTPCPSLYGAPVHGLARRPARWLVACLRVMAILAFEDSARSPVRQLASLPDCRRETWRRNRSPSCTRGARRRLAWARKVSRAGFVVAADRTPTRSHGGLASATIVTQYWVRCICSVMPLFEE